MTNKDDREKSMGPQGTQVFELDEVNKMIAAEIAESQSVSATIPALIGVSNNVTGQKFVLSKNKLEVGRRPNSDISLNESSVSAMHAHIIRDGENWKVLNLLSSNGTFVNGEKIVEKTITPGDRVAFAGAEFVFTLIDEPLAKKSTSKNLALVLVAVGLVAAFGGLLYFIL
ncbi:FHA domain-containing protein [Aliikangiella coralliicola]|uniref:FHA domain-containing protein n=1 Tax=Aliikangiella coralliicola TaxID=2592383 RepID=A0A545UC15_9GAMM|nr:FHA domain-containing protein [Aliikangiella coralliicola]TQV86997.1 FHA domain-containing protein [Aliikangiella coralliicola]